MRNGLCFVGDDAALCLCAALTSLTSLWRHAGMVSLLESATVTPDQNLTRVVGAKGNMLMGGLLLHQVRDQQPLVLFQRAA